MGDRTLRPLGTLAPQPGQEWTASALDLSRALDEPERTRVVEYLRGCPIFLAWMEYTRDEIGARFEVAGGSGIQSDGTYYWRVDAADYVREYGVAIPPAALAHFDKAGWNPPVFDRDEYVAIFTKIDDLVGTGAVWF